MTLGKNHATTISIISHFLVLFKSSSTTWGGSLSVLLVANEKVRVRSLALGFPHRLLLTNANG